MFAIEMRGVYMNQHGNWGSRELAYLFDSADHAQAFLDARPRMKAGHREAARVVPVTQSELREMSNTVADCLAAAERHGASLTDRMGWRARFIALVALQGAPV